jgi:hypothetical protein
MRKRKNRKKISTVFVLGAGTSKSLTDGHSNTSKIAPLDKEFTKRILETNCQTRHRWVNEARDRIIKDWLYHVNLTEVGLEKAIAQQISDLDFLKAIHPRRGNQLRSTIDYLEDITHLISFVLSKARIKNKTIMDKFISDYFNYEHPDVCPNRIITFNYDTLIDDHLLNRFKQPEYIYFDRIAPNGINARSRRELQYRFPLLLKLHGSVNWKCNKDEYTKIFIPPTNNGSNRTRTYNTNDCHYIENIWLDNKIDNPGDEVFPLIIPPIPDKPITNVAIFKYLWSFAFEYLHDCNEIVISGYSLPETDNLATSLFSKFENKSLNKITIIDPSSDTISKWMNLFHRKQISSHKVEYYPDFCEFVQNAESASKRKAKAAPV